MMSTYIRPLFWAWYDLQFVVCLALYIVLFFATGARVNRLAGSVNSQRIWPLVLVSALVGLWCFSALAYLVSPAYIDHLEPSVASLAILNANGLPIYPDPDLVGPYGMIYGPLLFQINTVALLVLKLVPTEYYLLVAVLAPSSKLAAIVALFSAILLWRSICVGSGRGRRTTAIAFLFMTVLALMPFGNYSVWNRAEPFLLFLAVASIAVSRQAGLPASICIGIVGGAMSGLKIHGFLYAAPAAIYFLSRHPTRIAVRHASVMIVSGLVCVALPLVRDWPMAVGYFRYLSFASHHALLFRLFAENALYAACFLLPFFRFFMPRYSGWPTARIFAAALLTPLVVVSVIASKEGSGPYHLVPFVPSAIYFALVFRPEASTLEPTFNVKYLAVAAIAFFPALVVFLDHVRNSFKHSIESSELVALLKLYPQAEVGPSDTRSYPSYYARVFQVWSNAKLMIDASAYMDLKRSGFDERSIEAKIKDCRVKTWILPTGSPWSVENFYDHQPLFSDSFRNSFLSSYKRSAGSQHYDLWQCARSNVVAPVSNGGLDTH